MTMSDFSCCWWPCQFWGVSSQGFCTVLLGTGFSQVFLMIRLKLWAWRRKTTEVKPDLQSHGRCVAVCCPSDPLQRSESQRNHHVWEVCSANWWDAWKLECLQLALVNRKGPILHDNTRMHITQQMLASKVERTGLQSVASSAIFTWPLANRLPFLQASRQLCAGKTLLQPAGGRKCFPRVHLILKHGFLHYRNKQTYFSLTKMYWLKWFLLWLIKMCLSLVIMTENSQSETAITFAPIWHHVHFITAKGQAIIWPVTHDACQVSWLSSNSFPSFHTLLFGRKSLRAAHIWGVDNYSLPPWGDSICRFLEVSNSDVYNVLNLLQVWIEKRHTQLCQC